MSVCERCKSTTSSLQMSFFNEEMLCHDCFEKEQKHPAYKLAKEIERRQVRNGNWKYPGIGKPADL